MKNRQWAISCGRTGTETGVSLSDGEGNVVEAPSVDFNFFFHSSSQLIIFRLQGNLINGIENKSELFSKLVLEIISVSTRSGKDKNPLTLCHYPLPSFQLIQFIGISPFLLTRKAWIVSLGVERVEEGM